MEAYSLNFDFRYWWQNRYSDQSELGGEPYARANSITPSDSNTPSRTLPTYGSMASERELGMSQRIEAMTPTTRSWHTQAVRPMSNRLASDFIYL